MGLFHFHQVVLNFHRVPDRICPVAGFFRLRDRRRSHRGRIDARYGSFLGSRCDDSLAVGMLQNTPSVGAPTSNYRPAEQTYKDQTREPKAGLLWVFSACLVRKIDSVRKDEVCHERRKTSSAFRRRRYRRRHKRRAYIKAANPHRLNASSYESCRN
jgi:hypothetical protein